MDTGLANQRWPQPVQRRSIVSMRRATVSNALEQTIAEAMAWLTAEDAALVGALRCTAAELDRSYSDRTMAEHRHGLRDLNARKAQRLSEMSPLDRLRMFME